MRTRIPHLPHLIRTAAPTAELVPDRALIAEFVTAKCGMAFELLVRRHGPTVWAVCRRHLANEHDAEDAFQATFLVLAKSARRIANTASVGSWLYGVAYRVALKARRTTARRKRIEAVVSPTDEPVTLPVPVFNDTTALVHAELERLPDRYRLPLLLCDLEGLSRKEASAQLGWSEGTLSGRLNRARKLLAGRLSGRGVAAAALVGVATVTPTQAKTATAVGVGLSVFGTSTTAAPEAVSALAHGAMRDMTRSFVLKAAGVALAASVLLGGGLFGLRFDATPQATAAPVPKVEMAKADDITDALLELVSQSAVQRELKLTAEQRVTLIDGLDKLAEGWEKEDRVPPVPASPIGGQLGGFGQAGGPGVPQLVQTGLPPLSGDMSSGLADDKYNTRRRELAASVLTKVQLRRLQQCEVQLLGLNAPLLKRVADDLALTVEQKKAIAKAIAGPAGAAAKHTAVANELTPAQVKRWEELSGAKAGFDHQRVYAMCPLGKYLPPVDPDADRLLPPVAPPPVLPQPPPQAGPLPIPAQPLPPPGNPGK